MEHIKNYFLYLANEHPIGILDIISGFIPIIFSIIFYKSVLKNNASLFYYSCIIFLFVIISNIYATYSLNNHDIYLFFYLIESGFLFYYFKKIIGEKSYKLICNILFLINSLFFLGNIFSEIDLMDDVSSTIQSFFFIFISIVNYYFILVKLKIEKLTSSSFFWINTATFIYFTAKFFVSLYLIEILGNNHNDDLVNYWGIVSAGVVIQRILISLGISKSSKQQSI